MGYTGLKYALASVATIATATVGIPSTVDYLNGDSYSVDGDGQLVRVNGDKTTVLEQASFIGGRESTVFAVRDPNGIWGGLRLGVGADFIPAEINASLASEFMCHVPLGDNQGIVHSWNPDKPNPVTISAEYTNASVADFPNGKGACDVVIEDRGVERRGRIPVASPANRL